MGFLQASGLVTYIGLIAAFLNNVEKLFGHNVPELLAAMTMLLLFVLSAVISALLVLGKAGFLFWEKQYSDAFALVLWTIGWGLLYLVLLITILFLI